MTTLLPNPPKVEIDFTDARLTAQGGWAPLARAARGLARQLARAVVEHCQCQCKTPHKPPK